MTTSWRKVFAKLKMNGLAGNKARVGSDESTTSTNSSTPQFTSHNRFSLENEWQMNYIINSRDGLFK